MPQKQSLENRVENKLSKTSLKDKVKKGISKALLPFVVAGSMGLGSLGLAGCATTGYGVSSEERLGYKFYDSHGDYKLVGRNNDIYLEKIDGTENKRITHTPETAETAVIFSKNGKYILYATGGYQGNYYMVHINSNDSTRREITRNEFIDL